jgi:hypothetical protein
VVVVAVVVRAGERKIKTKKTKKAVLGVGEMVFLVVFFTIIVLVVELG